MAVVRQDLQHGQAFAQPAFIGFGQPTQFLQQASPATDALCLLRDLGNPGAAGGDRLVSLFRKLPMDLA